MKCNVLDYVLLLIHSMDFGTRYTSMDDCTDISPPPHICKSVGVSVSSVEQ